MQNCEIKGARVEVTTSLEDWRIIRDCLVKAFHDYLLYEYMVPDDAKRSDFLRAYLDANYDVTVGSGQGILFAIKIPSSVTCDDKQNSSELPAEIIGGLLIIHPSWEGKGWVINDDQPYWEAYNKYKLGNISEEGLKRLKRYEAWENANVCKKLRKSEIPMGNGLFAGMLPEHTDRGYGSCISSNVLQILVQQWMQDQKIKLKVQNQDKFITPPLHTKEKPQTFVSEVLSENKESFVDRLKTFSLQNCHFSTLLSHRAIPHELAVAKSQQSAQANPKLIEKHSNVNSRTRSLLKEIPKRHHSLELPIAITICHGERPAHFYSTNMFKMVTAVFYHDEVANVAPFPVYILALDPFNTGRLSKLKGMFADAERLVSNKQFSFL